MKQTKKKTIIGEIKRINKLSAIRRSEIKEVTDKVKKLSSRKRNRKGPVFLFQWFKRRLGNRKWDPYGFNNIG